MTSSNSELLFALVVGIAYFCYQILQEIKQMKQEIKQMKQQMEWNTSTRFCKDLNRRLDLHYSKIYKMNLKMYHGIMNDAINHDKNVDGNNNTDDNVCDTSSTVDPDINHVHVDRDGTVVADQVSYDPAAFVASHEENGNEDDYTNAEVN